MTDALPSSLMAIDVMHVTKNLCVTLLGFLGVYGKTKDTPEAREDQQRMHGKDGIHQGHASYALTKEVKEIRSYQRREGNLL